MSDLNLDFLSFAPNVTRTDVTDLVITKLDAYFKAHNCYAVITSALRTAADQLRIIQQYAVEYNISIPAPLPLTMDNTVLQEINGISYPIWQVVWSELLNHGIIINPPVYAEVLFDYWRDGLNKKGEMIPPSPHFFGKAFDLSVTNRGPSSLNNIYSILTLAAKDNIGITSVVFERANNCVHTNCL